MSFKPCGFIVFSLNCQYPLNSQRCSSFCFGLDGTFFSIAIPLFQKFHSIHNSLSIYPSGYQENDFLWHRFFSFVSCVKNNLIFFLLNFVILLTPCKLQIRHVTRYVKLLDWQFILCLILNDCPLLRL